MSAVQISTGALLGLGVLAAALTSFGLLAARNVYQRLHAMGIAATVGVIAIVAAIVVQESWSQAGVKAMLTGLTLLFMNPILTHATALAARIHERGDWRPGKDEEVEREQP